MLNQQPPNDATDYEKLACEFYQTQEKAKRIQEKFLKLKQEFAQKMDTLFTANKVKAISFHDVECQTSECVKSGTLNVTKVVRTTIEWDADKLLERLSKTLSKKIIHKQYTVVNMPELIEYLKECGVDPVVFKRHIVVEKTVDHKAIEQADNLGQLTMKDIKGCYRVNLQKPYYHLAITKGGDDEE